jgi:iron complex outermembrane recepter protein
MALVAVWPAEAQTGATLSGRVTRDTGDPMAGAAVVIEDLKRETRTGEDGAYRFENVRPGSYHVSVRAEGYSSRRAEVTVTPQGATLDLIVELDMHFAEVVSVSPNPRTQFESYQPTSVLVGQELQKQLEATIGATLQAEPGVAMRSLGPGPARPVIRGLDGDRVAVLEDGQRMGDLSSQSADHGVPVNPAAAQRIEVVRGPATLLYGSNAIGGLVNIITDQIPNEQVTRPTGNFLVDFGTNGAEAGGAGDVHFGNGQYAFHVGGGGRRAGDYSTPDGGVDNSDMRTGFFNLGGAWTGERAYAGASYGYDDTEYGIPIVEEGLVRLDPRRHAFSVRAGGQGLDGALTSYRATLGVRRYQHSEIVGGEIGTSFENNTTEGEMLLSHRPLGRLSGTVGAGFLDRGFEAIGEEALSPPVDQNVFSLYLYEEVTWPHVTLQFGGRYDHTGFRPDGGLPDRDFNEFSGSVGLLVRPAAANDDLVIAASVARAARNPALEELYFFGPHPGNFAFEIGNPNLSSETGLGFDLSLRSRAGRFRGEITLFRNDINDYIFRNPISEDEFEEREEEFDERFNVSHDEEEEDGDEHGHEGEFPFVEFVGADSLIFGIEAHADLEITPAVIAELTYDWVQGELSDSGDPLPRIPPYRVLLGLRYQRNAFQLGGRVNLVADQTRVFGEETPTAGYGLVNLFGSYSFAAGGATNTITARLDNATDKVYRNHLNYLKDVLAERGVSFKVIYGVSF